MKFEIKAFGFGIRLDETFAGGSVGCPVTRYRRLTLFWMSYHFENKKRVKGWWWNERSYHWGARRATHDERLNYIYRMNAQRGLLDMPPLKWEE